MPLAIHCDVIVYEITFYARPTFGPVIAAINKMYYLLKCGSHDCKLHCFNAADIGPNDHIN